LNEEGCVTIEDTLVEIQRFLKLKVKYYNLDGKLIEKEIKGSESVCFQHELDHLNGVMITDSCRAQKISKNIEFLKWKHGNNDDE